VRIATWNVERPKPRGWKVPPAQLRRMAAVEADLWVVTETHLGYAPSAKHQHSVFSPPHPERRPEPERWASIWSRWPITLVAAPAPHPRGSVAGLVATPGGPVLVYGTVLAWANEPRHDDGRSARMWEVHLAEIDRQGAEWAQLRSAYPEIPMVVAGDFNQVRDGSGWYGTRATRDRLTDALSRAGLVCATDLDVVSAGLLEAHHLIDHICVTPDLAKDATVHCWEARDDAGQRLSDHPTVAVDLPWGQR
jgi:endonuclease/exonuclease/phosphatase family metal-dependent hydrolase